MLGSIYFNGYTLYIAALKPRFFWGKREIRLTGKSNYNKQLLDEVEHDIMNYQNLVSVLSAEAEG